MPALKRYTQLPQLLHMLKTRTIDVLSPTTWDDRNDTFFIDQYKKRKQLKSVLVLCMSRASDTYHHWHVFAGNPSGVRIDFSEARFRRWVAGIEGARLDRVRYPTLDRVRDLAVDDLPFVKRYAFRHEHEVRLVVEERRRELACKSLPFDYSMILRVVLSPWLPPSLFDSMRAVIEAVSPGAHFSIVRTSILANEEFMEAGEHARPRARRRALTLG